eukprot:gene13244-19080_t
MRAHELQVMKQQSCAAANVVMVRTGAFSVLGLQLGIYTHVQQVRCARARASCFGRLSCEIGAAESQDSIIPNYEISASNAVAAYLWCKEAREPGGTYPTGGALEALRAEPELGRSQLKVCF